MSDEAGRKILLIDDDTSLLVTLSDFLQFHDYEVITADSGEQGLHELAGLTPDLIILDMSMPGMGGIGFLREISGADGKPRYPVLVLTARANMAEFFGTMDVDGFIAKPCDPEDLLMEVSRIIFLRRGDRQNEGDTTPSTLKKVLLAEDDEETMNELLAAFRGAGYVVTTAAKGPEALEKAIVERPDLVVLKHILQNMNGSAVAKMLEDLPNTQTIPVVLYGEGAELAGTQEALKRADRRMVEGCDAAALLNAAEELLSSAKSGG